MFQQPLQSTAKCVGADFPCISRTYRIDAVREHQAPFEKRTLMVEFKSLHGPPVIGQLQGLELVPVKQALVSQVMDSEQCGRPLLLQG